MTAFFEGDVLAKIADDVNDFFVFIFGQAILLEIAKFYGVTPNDFTLVGQKTPGK